MQRLFSSLLTLLILLTPVPLNPSLDISYKVNEQGVAGLEVRLYYVGKIVDDKIVWSDDFTGFAYTSVNDVLSLQESAGAAEARIVGQHCDPAYRSSTDSSGRVSLRDVAPGVYCVLADVYTADGIFYEPVPTLAYVPDAKFIELKVTSTAVPEGDVDVTVNKVWKCRDDTPISPVSVTLLRNNVEYDMIELSSSNNWKYTWTRLDGDASWKVIETKVPDGFVASVTKSPTGYTITNTAINYLVATPQTGVGNDAHMINGFEILIIAVVGIASVVLIQLNKERFK